MRRISIALCLVATVGCGKEIARIPLHDVGSGKAIVDLDAGQKLSFWTQLDVAYSGSLGARYHIELSDANGGTVGNVTCDPLDVTVRLRSYRNNLGQSKADRYQGKMRDCALSAQGAGTYTVRTTLAMPTRPAQMTLNDISLVIKQ
jgi:hypothetical protein